MKQLIIIGAGGMGRTIYSNALESVGYGESFLVKGFIDDNVHALDGYDNYPPMLSTIQGYLPQADDVFVSAIGGGVREACIKSILSKGGAFMNLIHKTARIYTNVQLGQGNFIGAYSVIGNDAKIGDYNMIQSYVVIGHDSQIGSWNRLDTHVTCFGGMRIEDNVSIHTSSAINNNVVVGTGAHVGALSFVIRNVKPGTTVLGNPAKKIEL